MKTLKNRLRSYVSYYYVVGRAARTWRRRAFQAGTAWGSAAVFHGNVPRGPEAEK